MATNIKATPSMCCLNMQIALNERDPGNIMESTGFLDALRSPVNNRGFEQITFFQEKDRPGANALPAVEIKYSRPSCNAVNTTSFDLCDTGTPSTDPYGYLEVGVDMVASISGSFTIDDFNQLCESPQDRLASDIRKAADDIRVAMNQSLITAAYPLMGNYANTNSSQGATSKILNIINSEGYANVPAFAEIKREFRKQHTSVAPIVVAGEYGGMYLDVRNMGGTGQNSVNATNTNPFNITYDVNLDTTIQSITGDTDSHALSWIPGALQLLEWSRYKGYREQFKEDYVETTVNIDGMEFDYTLNYDKCNHRWTWSLTKPYDLFCIPDAAYQPCYDFNHKLAWKFGCGAFDCTQIGM